jgi:DNA-3-methyladenine glycosylase II
VLAFTDERLRGAGLSGNKTKALRDLAEKIVSGELPLRGIARHDDEEVIRRLTTVWGIGEWTAQMFLIFKLGRLDVMPAGDLGVQEGLRVLDGLDARPSPDKLLDRAEVWRPLCSVAAWFLWRLSDAR